LGRRKIRAKIAGSGWEKESAMRLLNTNNKGKVTHRRVKKGWPAEHNHHGHCEQSRKVGAMTNLKGDTGDKKKNEENGRGKNGVGGEKLRTLRSPASERVPLP